MSRSVDALIALVYNALSLIAISLYAHWKQIIIFFFLFRQ